MDHAIYIPNGFSPVVKHGNGKSIIYRGISFAMFDYRRIEPIMSPFNPIESH